MDYAELMESGLVASEPRFIYPDVPRGTWSTGIFDCMKHIPSCLTGCLCSCIIYGQVMTVSPEQASRIAIIRLHHFDVSSVAISHGVYIKSHGVAPLGKG